MFIMDTTHLFTEDDLTIKEVCDLYDIQPSHRDCYDTSRSTYSRSLMRKSKREARISAKRRALGGTLFVPRSFYSSR